MLETHPASAHEQLFAALERDGAVIADGLLESARVDRLVADFTPHLDAVAWGNSDSSGPDEFFGNRTKRLHGLLARSAAFAELLTQPLLLAMCDHFLGPRCDDYRVSTGELMALGRGESNPTLHRDADSWHHFPRPRPEILVSANLALTDFTEHNGATVVVPGSHQWEPERRASKAERGAAVMRRGSALLYSGNVLHGGGANGTEEVRIGLYVGYLLSWLRPIENHLITNGPEAVAGAPERVRRLLDHTPTGWEVLA